jgi:hypothetical protein
MKSLRLNIIVQNLIIKYNDKMIAERKSRFFFQLTLYLQAQISPVD